MNQNRGIDWARELAEQSDKDYPLGASWLSCMAEIPPEERRQYLPKGFVQVGTEDWMCCASAGPHALLKLKFNYLIEKKKLSFSNLAWLHEKGYIVDGDFESSVRFTAIKSNTTRQGNSIRGPIDAIYNFGVIPNKMFPSDPALSFDEYHDPLKITPEMETLGKEWKERFFINYGRGGEAEFPSILQRDILSVAGYAWPDPVNGEYPRVDYQPNHAFLTWLAGFLAFDTYIDPVDGDYIKKLASNYDFYDTGYRITINQKPLVPQKKSRFRELLSYWWKTIIA